MSRHVYCPLRRPYTYCNMCRHLAAMQKHPPTLKLPPSPRLPPSLKLRWTSRWTWQRAKALKPCKLPAKPCKLWPKTLQDNGARLQDNESIKLALKPLKKRLKPAILNQIVVDLCKIKGFECSELAELINRDETYVRTIVTKLVKSGRLRMKYPEMPNHPHQAYTAAKQG